jgi:hypothetical protein
VQHPSEHVIWFLGDANAQQLLSLYPSVAVDVDALHEVLHLLCGLCYPSADKHHKAIIASIDAGVTLIAGTNGVGHACRAGTYNTDGIGVCLRHAKCSSGQYLAGASASAAGSCSNCAAGQHNTDGVGNCDPHTTCSPGEYLTGESASAAGSCAPTTTTATTTRRILTELPQPSPNVPLSHVCVDLRQDNIHHHVMYLLNNDGTANIIGGANSWNDARTWKGACSGTCAGLVGTWSTPNFYSGTITISADYSGDFTAASNNDHMYLNNDGSYWRY